MVGVTVNFERVVESKFGGAEGIVPIYLSRCRERWCGR